MKARKDAYLAFLCFRYASPKRVINKICLPKMEIEKHFLRNKHLNSTICIYIRIIDFLLSSLYWFLTNKQQVCYNNLTVLLSNRNTGHILKGTKKEKKMAHPVYNPFPYSTMKRDVISNSLSIVKDKKGRSLSKEWRGTMHKKVFIF